MIDFHSHILPNIDDGSKSAEESIEMLKMLSEQGVTKVVATPHFFANDESVEDFLKRRQNSYKMLEPQLISNFPQVLLGAEVKYYQGLSFLDGLNKLCIEKSNILLLEMPMCRWTEYIIKELVNITLNNNIIIVLAHIERYLSLQSRKTLKKLEECGILLQVNADFFINVFTRKRALRMIYNRSVQFIGSDCHNLTSRPPNIGKAAFLIKKKYGDVFLNSVTDFGNSLLLNNVL